MTKLDDDQRRGVKMAKRITAAMMIVVVCGMASAEIIKGVDIEFVTIGDPGNAADTQVMSTDGTSGYGSVNYEYRIGMYEITNKQWNDFVAIAGAPTGSSTLAYIDNGNFSGDLQPANEISWLEALQFCNYLTSGNKNDGAYVFNGSGELQYIDRDAAAAYGKVYALPTEDEWYKAAYYNTAGGVYSLYANGRDTVPSTSESCYETSEPWDVGTGIEEVNGTYDMMGNVWEWNEDVVDGVRGIRGGAYYDFGNAEDYLSSDYRSRAAEYFQQDIMGFRIVELIPEPATMMLLGIGGVVVYSTRK